MPRPLVLHTVAYGEPLYTRAVELRFKVLREPLGIAREAWDLSSDREAIYFIATEGDEVVGVVALHGDRLRQMAVEPTRQGEGIGRRLVAALEHHAATHGIGAIVLHARETAVGFYRALGYVAQGEPFTEVDIPHLLMKKALFSPAS